jgi:hypothetical protein
MIQYLHHWRARAAHVFLACCVVFPASAMESRPCNDPRVFSRSPVNVLLLPYTYTGTRAQMARPLSEAAGRLGLLMEHDSLVEMTKYQAIGVVNLVRTPGSEPCDANNVWEQLVGPRRDPGAGLRPGGGVVMMWGRIYEEGTALYVQSYLRFARADTSERVERTLPASSYGPAIFAATLPTQVVTLPPRRITLDDIASINNEFSRLAVVRDAPNEGAKIIDRLPDLGTPDQSLRPFGYAVVDVRGDWVRVASLYGGPPGWIARVGSRARSAAGTAFPRRRRRLPAAARRTGGERFSQDCRGTAPD